MARRGDELSEHLLETAKHVFLERGFERASMDEVAARAGASKRTIYVRFATKEQLFLAVVDRTGDLFESRLLDPAHYSSEPVEACVRFCGRFLQLLRWATVLRTWRLGMAEAERIPDAAAGLHRAFVDGTIARLRDHLVASGWTSPVAQEAAERILGVALFPALPAALFGVAPTREDAPDERDLDGDIDLDRIRSGIVAVLDIAPRA